MTHALDEHFAAASRVLASHGPESVLDERDHVVVAALGRGGSDLNVIFATGVPADPDGTLRWACERAAESGRPFSLQVPGPMVGAFDAAIGACGLAPSSVMPAMQRAATTDVPPLPPGLRIERVADEDMLRVFGFTVATGFGAPDPAAATETFPPSLYDDDRNRLYVGYAGDEPVGTAVSVCVADIAGIYAITVLPAARGRGYGAALTWAAIAAGTRDGVEVTALQASPMGEPVYRAMGFTAVRDYHRFELA